MESKMFKIYARSDDRIQLKIYPGHFATPQSHITHFLDITTMKSRSSEARRIAEEKGLDICKVSPPDVTPAPCKLMDYGKYRYDQQKREKEQRKNQRIVELKEVRLSATIDIGDTKRLAAQTAKFIQEGNKVKASIRLKGRQQAHPDIAIGIIKDYIEMVGEDAVVEKAPVQEGRMIFTILAPKNKK